MRIERDTLYSMDDLATGLGISVRTLQRLIARGDVPAKRLGKKVFVLGADLLNALPAWRMDEPKPKPKPKGKGGSAPGAGTYEYRVIE